jgi:hypothetical protein
LPTRPPAGGRDGGAENRTDASNRGVVYAGPGKVEVETIDYRNWSCGRPPGVTPINKNRP